jgi:hypothetical protein
MKSDLMGAPPDRADGFSLPELQSLAGIDEDGDGGEYPA